MHNNLKYLKEEERKKKANQVFDGGFLAWKPEKVKTEKPTKYIEKERRNELCSVLDNISNDSYWIEKWLNVLIYVATGENNSIKNPPNETNIHFNRVNPFDWK